MSKNRNKRNIKSSLKALRKRRASGGRVKAFTGSEMEGNAETYAAAAKAAMKGAQDAQDAQERDRVAEGNQSR